MSEMVERVARAICKARGRDPDGPTGYVSSSSPAHYVKNWETARGEARAAIEAMREPTAAMARAGLDTGEFENGEFVVRASSAANVYEAMIDEALKK